MLAPRASSSDWGRRIKRDAHAVYPAARDSRVPWYAKVLALCVAAYALSPIDLIPDFIPVLGYLDDIIIVPLGIIAVVKLIPEDVMTEHRKTATFALEKPTSRRNIVVGTLKEFERRVYHATGNTRRLD